MSKPQKIGKYLSVRILSREKGRKTDRWEVFNHTTHDGFNDPLADISWYTRWRQYVFDPNLGTVWNDRCLKDVVAFLKSENEKRRRR